MKLWVLHENLETLEDYMRMVDRKSGSADYFIDHAYARLGLNSAVRLAKYALEQGYIDENQFRDYQQRAVRKTTRKFRKEFEKPAPAIVPDEEDEIAAICRACPEPITSDEAKYAIPKQGVGWFHPDCAARLGITK